MRIVAVGGSGLIGSKVVRRLREGGHDVVAASPETGVNSITGEGLAEALEGADAVVDVANSPSFEAEPALSFFLTSGRNLLAAEQAAGVQHHIALSVVGTDRLQASAYFRAKLTQEELIEARGVSYTIVRSTQFFEFLGRIAGPADRSPSVRLSPVLIQPVAGDDVAAVLADLAIGSPLNETIEVAGPEAFRLHQVVEEALRATGDGRSVFPDAHAPYFGAELGEQTLMPGDGARIGPTRFSDWLRAGRPMPAATPATMPALDRAPSMPGPGRG